MKLSRPVRLITSGVAYGSQVALTSYEITPLGFDVIVHFRNGAGGEILWTAEADASAGSKSESFYNPLLFTKGVYVDIIQGTPESVCVGLDLPQSAGTS